MAMRRISLKRSCTRSKTANHSKRSARRHGRPPSKKRTGRRTLVNFLRPMRKSYRAERSVVFVGTQLKRGYQSNLIVKTRFDCAQREVSLGGQHANIRTTAG